MHLLQKVKGCSLPEGQYAVFGSGLLEVYGLRAANDIDIAVTPQLLKQLAKTGAWQVCCKRDITYLAKDDIELYDDWNIGQGYNPPVQKLIEEATIIQGVPFVNIHEVLKLKRHMNRPKDQADVRLLEQFLQAHQG